MRVCPGQVYPLSEDQTVSVWWGAGRATPTGRCGREQTWSIVPLSIRGEARSLIRRSSQISTGNSGSCYVIVMKHTTELQLQIHKDNALRTKYTNVTASIILGITISCDIQSALSYIIQKYVEDCDVTTAIDLQSSLNIPLRN